MSTAARAHPEARPSHWRGWRLWGLLLCALPLPVSAAPLVLLLSEQSALYQRFAQTFKATLALTADAPGVEVRALPLTRFEADTRLVVAVGARAAQALASETAAEPSRGHHPPQLLALVTRNQYERQAGAAPIAGGVVVDPPDARYAALLRLALPTRSPVWLLASPENSAAIDRLAASIRGAGLQVEARILTDASKLPEALAQIYASRGVLVATPDSGLFNTHTIPGILLGAFHHDFPVVGFSPGYLEAGAVLALYASPEQLARQSARQALAALAGTAPGMEYATAFSVARNDHAMRSLDLRLSSAAELETRLLHEEEKR